MREKMGQNKDNGGILDDRPLWKIVMERLLNPRTWLYPILVAAIAFFILPRFANRSKVERKTPVSTEISSESGSSGEKEGGEARSTGE